MRKRIYCSVLLSAVLLFFISGCDQSPIENNYYYTGVDSLSDPNTLPRVVFTNPADGSYGPFGNTDPTQYPEPQQITIQFNKLLNIKNIGPNSIILKTDDAYHSLSLIDGYSNIFNHILVFNVNDQYLASKTYTLLIDTTLKDIHGNKLNTPHIVSFMPEPKFRLFRIYPSSDDIEPSSISILYLHFNSKINTTIFNSFSITPNIDGNWMLGNNYYYNDSLSAFYNLTDTLAFNSNYTISISSNAKDYNGLPIDKSYQYSFKTVPFRVRIDSYSGYMGPGGFYIYNNFNFRFNGKVDTSTVRNSISVSPQISFDLSFPYGTNSNYVNIDFNDIQFQRNTKYTIYFNSNIRSSKRDVLEEYNFPFSTGQ